MKPDAVKVPGWLPDVPEVRSDILDYYLEVERFDREFGELITALKQSGEYDNTLIIITGDNGMPFPRAKANVYDSGSKIPLILTMKGRVEPMEVSALVSLTDIAPTILELCGQKVPSEMTGSSLWPLLRKQKVEGRDIVFTERERHANVRKPELGYPCRALRTKDFLYIRNYEPDRWPAGDPDVYHSVGPFGDVDASPSKQYIMDQRQDPAIAPFFARAFGKRPAEELYDLQDDPDQLRNVVTDKKHSRVLSRLRKQMDDWQASTRDPRASGRKAAFDQYPYFGPPVKGAPSTYKPQLNK
jgi:arylsulfatase A-like enzyme